MHILQGKNISKTSQNNQMLLGIVPFGRLKCHTVNVFNLWCEKEF